MRLPLSTLEIFEAIGREGSLRAAATRLGVQPSTVSHQLKALETQLGVTLFTRTTRSITLTEAGQALFRGCNPAFDQIESAIQSARDVGRSRRGSLRITMPGFAYDMFVADKLGVFRAACPEVELEISIDETFVDLFQNKFHAGIRLGDRLDPDMIAVRISPPLELAVLASETYLEKNGRPRTPENLMNHECIQYRFRRSGNFAPWDFRGKDGPYTVNVSGKLIVNTLSTLYAAVRAGHGLGYSFSHYRPNIADAPITPLLQSDIEPINGAFLYFPREYKSHEILRIFIDIVKAPRASAN